MLRNSVDQWNWSVFFNIPREKRKYICLFFLQLALLFRSIKNKAPERLSNTFTDYRAWNHSICVSHHYFFELFSQISTGSPAITQLNTYKPSIFRPCVNSSLRTEVYAEIKCQVLTGVYQAYGWEGWTPVKPTMMCSEKTQCEAPPSHGALIITT